MRIAVEVLVPLRLFVCRFLLERRRSLFRAVAVVAHLNLNFLKKFRLEVHIMLTTKPEKKRNGGSGKKARGKTC